MKVNIGFVRDTPSPAAEPILLRRGEKSINGGVIS